MRKICAEKNEKELKYKLKLRNTVCTHIWNSMIIRKRQITRIAIAILSFQCGFKTCQMAISGPRLNPNLTCISFSLLAPMSLAMCHKLACKSIIWNFKEFPKATTFLWEESSLKWHGQISRIQQDTFLYLLYISTSWWGWEGFRTDMLPDNWPWAWDVRDCRDLGEGLLDVFFFPFHLL